MDKNNIEIKIAKFSDSQHAEAVISLMNMYANDPLGGGQDLSEFCQQNLIKTLQQRHDTFVLLAFYQQQAIALATCMDGFSTFQCRPLLNIHDLYVAKSHRGLGIAQSLFEKITQIAIEKDCCKLTLEVLQGNDVAKSLYKKLGFNAFQLNEQFGNAVFWEKPL